MSDAERPTTDVDEIKDRLSAIESALTGFTEAISKRLDGHAEGINAIGGNMQWLVEHAQGIFQMFSNPQFMSQMTNALMGGLNNAGQAGPDNSGPDNPIPGVNVPGGFSG